jgi:hypothetical protein
MGAPSTRIGAIYTYGAESTRMTAPPTRMVSHLHYGGPHLHVWGGPSTRMEAPSTRMGAHAAQTDTCVGSIKRNMEAGSYFLEVAAM